MTIKRVNKFGNNDLIYGYDSWGQFLMSVKKSAGLVISKIEKDKIILCNGDYFIKK